MQRLCELLTQPKRHYKRVDKFMRGLEKVKYLSQGWNRILVPHISLQGQLLSLLSLLEVKNQVFPREDFGAPPPSPPPQKVTKLPCARKGALTQNNRCRPQRLAIKVH